MVSFFLFFFISFSFFLFFFFFFVGGDAFSFSSLPFFVGSF